MACRIFHRLVAIASTLVLLTVATSQLLCAAAVVHADEWQSVSLEHEHVLCECEVCPCSDREATLAVQWKTIDDTTHQPVAMTTDSRYEGPSMDSTRIKQSFVPPDAALSSHLRSQKVIVILI